MNISSETYADFTLSRIPPEIRESLSDQQYFAVRAALIAREQRSRHSVDIRFSVPLFFRSYYIVLFAGRDRRKSRDRLEANRWNSIPEAIRMSFYYLASAMLSMSLLLLVFLGLYMVKRLMGIDVIPGFHLDDVFEYVRLASAQRFS